MIAQRIVDNRKQFENAGFRITTTKKPQQEVKVKIDLTPPICDRIYLVNCSDVPESLRWLRDRGIDDVEVKSVDNWYFWVGLKSTYEDVMDYSIEPDEKTLLLRECFYFVKRISNADPRVDWFHKWLIESRKEKQGR